MKGFVASWFFPPSTSAEGLVTFKLLKASKYNYDVCSSLSNQWSYKIESQLVSENINNIAIDTDDLDVWRYEAVKQYEMKKEEYDFIMTRSMPPESHKVGLEIKKKYPNTYWIASFADPIACNPYELLAYVKNGLPNKISNFIMKKPKKYIAMTSILPNKGLSILREMQKLETEVLASADMFIFPSIEQCQYSLGKRYDDYKEKCLIIPHTYDKELFPSKIERDSKEFIFTYIGHADSIRNPSKFIEALKIIREIEPNIFKRIKLRFVGNIPRSIIDMSYAFFLYNNVYIEEPVDYLESLKIMMESDCLLHVDGKFDFLENGSIFFASKLADYMGAGKPILGIVTEGSPAANILKESNNLCCNINDIQGIAENMLKVVKGAIEVDMSYYNKYNVQSIYNNFDKAIKDKNL